MSRFYQMEIDVFGVQKNKVRKVISVCKSEWECDNLDSYQDKKTGLYHVYMSGCDYLYAGQTENEFAKSLSHSIKSEDPTCKVNVNALYLEGGNNYKY